MYACWAIAFLPQPAIHHSVNCRGLHVLQGLVARSIFLLHYWWLLLYIFQVSAAATARARRRAAQAQYRMFGPSVPDHTIAIGLGLIFSCINPLVLVAAFVYFVVANTEQRYQWLYVYRRWYESGGRMWKQVRHIDSQRTSWNTALCFMACGVAGLIVELWSVGFDEGSSRI